MCCQLLLLDHFCCPGEAETDDWLFGLRHSAMALIYQVVNLKVWWSVSEQEKPRYELWNVWNCFLFTKLFVVGPHIWSRLNQWVDNHYKYLRRTKSDFIELKRFRINDAKENLIEISYSIQSTVVNNSSGGSYCCWWLRLLVVGCWLLVRWPWSSRCSTTASRLDFGKMVKRWFFQERLPKEMNGTIIFRCQVFSFLFC